MTVGMIDLKMFVKVLSVLTSVWIYT